MGAVNHLQQQGKQINIQLKGSFDTKITKRMNKKMTKNKPNEIENAEI